MANPKAPKGYRRALDPELEPPPPPPEWDPTREPPATELGPLARDAT